LSNGEIIECKIVQSDIGDIAFEKNVVLVVKKWKFPVIQIENDTTIVEYPFIFDQY
jgi:outer membrane biosynthesis protein TonB